MFVHGRARRLNDVHVLAAYAVRNLYLHLSVREAIYCDSPEGGFQQACHLAGERFVRVARIQHKVSCVVCVSRSNTGSRDDGSYSNCR